jgi:hypothetical protein
MLTLVYFILADLLIKTFLLRIKEEKLKSFLGKRKNFLKRAKRQKKMERRK